MQSDESTFLASPADVVGFEQWCAAYIRLQPVPLRLQPPPPTVAASASYGCSLRLLRLQPPPHTVAARASYGCSLRLLRLQPVLPTVAAAASYGYSPCFLRLQPVPPTVAASATYGCRCAGFELLNYTQRIEGVLRDHDGLRVCHTGLEP